MLIAYDATFGADVLEREADKLAAYASSVNDAGKGATMIDGVMSDRATDRHARVLLRQATAMGHFDAKRARALGIIDDAELAEAVATTNMDRRDS